MISTYEVGAVFTIEDQATARLNIIADGLERLAKLATATTDALKQVGVGVRGLGALAAKLDKVTGALNNIIGAADKASSGIDSAMASVTTTTETATAQVTALKNELVASTTAARELRQGGPINLVRGGGGNGRGPGGGGVRDDVPTAGAGALGLRLAGIGAKLTTVPAMAAEFTAYEAGKMALEERQAIATTLLNLQLPATGPEAKPYRDSLYALTTQAAKGTIYNEAQTAALMQEASRMTGFTGKAGEQNFESVFPTAVRMAEVGEYFHLGSAKENVLSAMRYAHLTGRYNAAELTPGLDQVLNLSRYSGMSINSLENTMAQGLPMVRAAGGDVDTGAALIAYLSRAGLGRRAGYSVGQMIMGLTDTGGPLSANLRSVHGSLEHSLGANAPHFKHPSKHAAALTKLGMLDHGKLTVLDQKGNIDLTAMMDKLAVDAAKFPKAEFLALLHSAFGIRGLRGASLIDQGLFSTFQGVIKDAPPASVTQAALAAQPLQQLEQIWARLKDIVTVLATGVMPEVQAILAVFLTIANGLNAALHANPAVNKIAGGTVVGAGLGALVAGPPGALIGAFLGALVGNGVALGTAPASNEHLPVLPKVDLAPIPKGLPQFLHGKPASAPLLHKDSWNGGGSGNGGVHIDNLVLHGTPHDADQAWVEKIMSAMADRMHSASKTNLGSGFGWDESPFTQVSV